VSELIDPATESWDVGLLEENFDPIDVCKIHDIPLSPSDTDDSVACHETRNYIFSDRSAYHMEWQHQYGSRSRRREDVGTSQTNLVWKETWNLVVIAKVRIFIWRVLHGIIPCMCILANRHVGNSGQCPACAW
jgi:hypothetical protein